MKLIKILLILNTKESMVVDLFIRTYLLVCILPHVGLRSETLC